MNPFDYQSTVGPTRLIDRRAELDALQRAAADRTAVRLAAPRRFGKTTLLDAHIASMRAVGHRAVRVDFSKVATVADASARVAGAFAALPSDPRRSVRRWAARLGLSAKLGPVTVRVDPRSERVGREDARAAFIELLDVPRALAEADGGLTVVCLDEFQDLLVSDEALDGVVRSVIQHHGEAAAYVFAGSQPSLMRALFTDQERPFFGQARPLDLPELPVDEAAADLRGIFEDAGFAPAGSPAIDVSVTVLEDLGSDAHVFFHVDAPRVSSELLEAAEQEASLIVERNTLFNARVDPRTPARVGERLRLAVDASRFHFFDPRTGASLLGPPPEPALERAPASELAPAALT
jgi:hypothetical protein